MIPESLLPKVEEKSENTKKKNLPTSPWLFSKNFEAEFDLSS